MKKSGDKILLDCPFKVCLANGCEKILYIPLDIKYSTTHFKGPHHFMAKLGSKCCPSYQYKTWPPSFSFLGLVPRGPSVLSQ